MRKRLSIFQHDVLPKDLLVTILGKKKTNKQNIAPAVALASAPCYWTEKKETPPKTFPMKKNWRSKKNT